MSADVLRQAAALMRSRAEAATGVAHHWRVARNSKPGAGFVACGGVHIAVTDEALTGGPSNAEHIASWHPAVALAVADWLDREADYADVRGIVAPPALAVATAYLGTDA